MITRLIWTKWTPLSSVPKKADKINLSLSVFYYHAVLWCAQILGPMIILICLHITLPHFHHYADLSEVIELLKCFSDTCCLKCVSKIKWILSFIFHAIYGAVWIQLTHFSYDDCENMCTLSYCYNQIGSITYLPLFRVKSWNNGVCCMSLCIIVWAIRKGWLNFLSHG